LDPLDPHTTTTIHNSLHPPVGLSLSGTLQAPNRPCFSPGGTTAGSRQPSAAAPAALPLPPSSLLLLLLLAMCCSSRSSHTPDSACCAAARQLLLMLAIRASPPATVGNMCHLKETQPVVGSVGCAHAVSMVVFHPSTCISKLPPPACPPPLTPSRVQHHRQTTPQAHAVSCCRPLLPTHTLLLTPGRKGVLTLKPLHVSVPGCRAARRWLRARASGEAGSSSDRDTSTAVTCEHACSQSAGLVAQVGVVLGDEYVQGCARDGWA
jgi:hypothetical protein